MTGMQLRAQVFDDLNAILDDEGAMMKLRSYLSRLRKKAATTPAAAQPYTMEELNARLDRAEAADEADELIPHSEVMQRARKYLNAL